MAFENWPYTNFHDLNLDWILDEVKKAKQAVTGLSQKIIDAAPHFANPVEWDGSLMYAENLIVSSNNKMYVSRKPVPSGIVITDTDYWVLVSDYNPKIAQIEKELADHTAQLNNLNAKTDEYSVIDFRPVDVLAIGDAIFGAAKCGDKIIGFNDTAILEIDADYNTILRSQPFNTNIVPHANDMAELDSQNVYLACGAPYIVRVDYSTLSCVQVSVPFTAETIHEISKCDLGYFMMTTANNMRTLYLVSNDLAVVLASKTYDTFPLLYSRGDKNSPTQGSFCRGNHFYSIVANVNTFDGGFTGYSTMIYNAQCELVATTPAHQTTRSEFEGVYDNGDYLIAYMVGVNCICKLQPVGSLDGKFAVSIVSDGNTFGRSRYLETAFLAAGFKGVVRARATLETDIDEDFANFGWSGYVDIIGNNHSISARTSGYPIITRVSISDATIVSLFTNQSPTGGVWSFVNCTFPGGQTNFRAYDAQVSFRNTTHTKWSGGNPIQLTSCVVGFNPSSVTGTGTAIKCVGCAHPVNSNITD